MHFPLSPGDAHEQVLVLDGDPRGEDLHGVFKVGFHEDVADAVDQRGRGGVEDVERRAERRVMLLFSSCGLLWVRVLWRGR